MVELDADVTRESFESLDVLLSALFVRSTFSRFNSSVFSVLDLSWLRLRRPTRASAPGLSSAISSATAPFVVAACAKQPLRAQSEA